MAADFHYHNDREYGDLSRMGNLPRSRVHRSVTFTTDRFGYRNPASNADGPPAVLVFGSSMACCSGTTDEQMLSARLSACLGLRVYNAAPGPQDLSGIRTVADRLGVRKGVVLLEHLDRYPVPTLADRAGPGMQRRAGLGLVKRLGLEDEAQLAYGWWKVEPVAVLAESAMRTLKDDRVLPNPYRRNVLEKPLPGGGSMLFLTSPLPVDQRPQDAGNVEYWSWLADELRRQDLTLVILLVPEKHTIYLPLLDPSSPEGTGESGLDHLEASLKAERVPVVNLLPVFRERAKAGLGQRSYLYWPDDTHWSPQGVGIAADLVCRTLVRGGLVRPPNGSPP
jgi:hypothetical protein